MPKTALITGAGSGIGRGLAHALARRGYHLLLVGRDESKLETVARETNGFTTASFFRTDLADPKARSRLIESVLAQTGAPDLLIHNAAVMPAGGFLQRPTAEIEATLSINLIAPAELTRGLSAAPTPPQGVIFILSTAARFPQPYNSLYSASKSGLRALAESLQIEFAGSPRICLVYPPLTETPMTEGFATSRWPVRKADALQVAEKIVSAYASGQDEISWFDWEIIPGLLYRLAPGFFRRMLKSQRETLREMFKGKNTDR